MAELQYAENGRLLFTEEMRKDYTILMPNMLPLHFRFLEKVFNTYGYKAKLLTTTGRRIVDEGLRYTHNDTCYPALLVIGQFIDALKYDKSLDLHKTALIMVQTGGGCRASNYIHLIRKALIKCGMEYVPVISLAIPPIEKNPGFHLPAPMLAQIIVSLCYADILMLLSNQVRPYENNKGDTDRLVDKWMDILIDKKFSFTSFDKLAAQIVKDFEAIPYTPNPDVVKVGIVGEIFIKYSPLGNNELQKFLESEGCEVYCPGLIDFLIFMGDHHVVETELYHVKYKKYFASLGIKGFFKMMQNKIIAAVKDSRFFGPTPFEHAKADVEQYISPANKMGEGWLLTAEMVDMIHMGINNIVCAQPFGCLPNHIIGKGMVRKLREMYPQSNIVPIDYDPGATRVNQENRIKLMLSTARANMAENKQD
ncbi:MAG: 2-hydroxyacyl-CoA dehydratase [Oscillospiraceae bacterium]|nr:2-hydroxyacyl-CoA dehydratase [Oscillospiraceae bacterium]MBQ8978561.1 2-hydroxyacyl-CoA dehydratase [Oscillospiraceae bacterium]